jgi:hypothetical protein
MNISSAAMTIFLTTFMLRSSSALRCNSPSPMAFVRHVYRGTIVSLKAETGSSVTGPVRGGEEIMEEKQHGTSEKPVQKDLRWNCDFQTADRICNFNRHYAEHSGYWQTKKEFVDTLMEESKKGGGPIDYFDSVTGKLLFTAPKGRTYDMFIKESMSHGWPSFRDEEVNWENVRILQDGECVSTTGTHLGHNIPDTKGNRSVHWVYIRFL